ERGLEVARVAGPEEVVALVLAAEREPDPGRSPGGVGDVAVERVRRRAEVGGEGVVVTEGPEAGEAGVGDVEAESAAAEREAAEAAEVAPGGGVDAAGQRRERGDLGRRGLRERVGGEAVEGLAVGGDERLAIARDDVRARRRGEPAQRLALEVRERDLEVAHD